LAQLHRASQRTDNRPEAAQSSGFNIKTNMAKMANNSRTKSGSSTRKQEFSFSAPSAMSVQLVGDFTQWQQNPINMKKGSEGIWHASVPLEPGTHHYRFLVDGQWRDDPECTLRVPNPYGGQDSVRQVA
jgi:1,4-alpha-glucan branching enzyme